MGHLYTVTFKSFAQYYHWLFIVIFFNWLPECFEDFLCWFQRTFMWWRFLKTVCIDSLNQIINTYLIQVNRLSLHSCDYFYKTMHSLGNLKKLSYLRLLRWFQVKNKNLVMYPAINHNKLLICSTILIK